MENSCNSLCSDFTSHYMRCSIILPDIPRNATSNKHEQRHWGLLEFPRAHNNPANYFGNTNAASIFSAIIRTSARTARASTEATGPSFSPGRRRRRRRRTHTHARGLLCGCVCGRWRPRDGVGVGQDSFENLADMLSAAASVLGDTLLRSDSFEVN